MFTGPKIINDNLILSVDIGNTKCFDASENLLIYSEQLDNVAWTKTRGSAVSNTAISPDNTLTADSFIEDTTATSSHFFFGSAVTLTIGLTYTFSCYVMANGRNFIAVQGDIGQGNLGGPTGFDLSTGVYTLGTSVTSASITNVGSGWYRISVTAVATGINAYAGMALRTSYGTGIQTYTGDGVSGIFIWGSQFERGSTVSSYYRTTNSVKNRGTNLVDISKNNKNGTLVNNPTYSSLNNGHLLFDGVDDHIIFNHQLFPLNAFTFDIWFKPSLNDTIKIFWMYEMQVFFSTVAKNVYRRWYNNNITAIAYQESFTPSYNGMWVNFCWTIGSYIDIVYINGLQVGLNRNSTIEFPTITGYNGQTNSATYIGRDEEAIYKPFDISSIKIYSKSLTATEIQQNFNSTRKRYGI
jgi:hypothetical protein